jgi:CheY-like chemotaxis protein
LGLKFLVVDDDPNMLEFIKESFSRMPIGIVKASNGKEALQLLQEDLQGKREIYCVLSDIKMPVMDGIEFYQHFLLLEQELPFYFMTGIVNAISSLKKIGMEDRYIEKPFGKNELMQFLAKVLPP